MSAVMQTRRPTGRPAWPLILVEGPEKSGKSFLAAELAASPRIGRTVWFDLGEGSGDEYLDPEDPRHELVVHNGSYAALLEAVTDARAAAAKALANGERPHLFVLDSGTAEWELLSSIVDRKARDRLARKTKREVSADETVTIGTDLWNEANAKHRRLMTPLMTFPGFAVVTARGKEVVRIGDDGKPQEGKRDYKVEGQKTLGYDASIWLRLSRDEAPTVVGVRTKNEQFRIRPGVDQPRRVPDLTLERLLFDLLGYDAGADVRDLVTPKVTAADRVEPEEEPMWDPSEQQNLREAYENEIAKATADEIAAIGQRVARARKAGELSPATVDHLTQAAAARKAELNGGGTDGRPAAEQPAAVSS